MGAAARFRKGIEKSFVASQLKRPLAVANLAS